jgi:hypothetical protein
MRLLKKIAILMLVAGILIGAWLGFVWHHPPTVPPAGRLYLLSYSNIPIPNPGKNSMVYPDPGNWIRVQMLLTNEGNTSLTYDAWVKWPKGWANVETSQGTTNGYLAPNFTGSWVVLRPGSVVQFSVYLPTNTLRWQCGFDIETASMKARTIKGILDSKFYRMVPKWLEWLFYPVLWLPDEAGPTLELKSASFEISDADRGVIR